MKLSEIKNIIDEQLCKDSIAALVQNDKFWKSNEKILVRAASYLQEKGLPERSIELVEEILRKCNHLSLKADLDLKYILGDSFYDLDRFEDGVRIYTEIIKSVEGDVAFTNRGLAFWELHKYRAAVSDYREAIKLNPMNYIALRGAGDCLIKLGEFQKAIPYLNAAIKINPKYAPAHTALGAAYFKIEEFKAATIALKKAITLDPTDQRAVRGLTETESRLRKEV